MQYIAIDSEFAPGRDDDPKTRADKTPLACVTWAKTDGTAGIWHHTEAKCHVVRCLEHDTIITHSGANDMLVFLRQWPDLVSLVWEAYAEGRILDIRLAQKLADISDGSHEAPRYIYNGSPYNLAAMAFRHFRVKLEKDKWRMLYGALRHVPLREWPKGAVDYPIDDARVTMKLYLLIARKYGEVATGDLVRQSQHGWAFRLLEWQGIRTDPELVAKVKALTEAEWRRLGKHLRDNGLVRVERRKYVKNTKVVKELVRLLVPRELWKLTDKGQKLKQKKLPFNPEDYISTDDEVCTDSGDPLLMKYASFVSLGGKLSGQYPHLAKGQIHVHFESLADTGRSRSGKPYNLQNPPQGRKGVVGERECFVPPPGCVFIDNDFGGLELCTSSQMNIDLYGRSAMAKVLNGGKNVHTYFGAKLLKCSYEEMASGKANKVEKYLGAYEPAKRSNFGFGGGMGPKRFAHTCKLADPPLILTEDEAKDLKAGWLSTFPEWRLHFNAARNATGSFERPKKARVKLLRVNRWRGGLTYSEYCNTFFQALGADCAKDSLFEVTRACYDPAVNSVLLGSRPVNFVHDQIITATPEEGAHEAALEQTRIMIETANRFLPDVPVGTEPTLARRWSKFAETVKDKHGRLVPWEHSAI